MALTAQLTGLVHLGVVRHERCAEHGELVEVAIGDSQPEREHSDHDGVYAAGALVADEDDHCAVAFRVGVHAAAFCGTVSDVAVADLVGVAGSIGAAAEAEGSLDLLAVAPKTSPPTA